MALIFFSLRFSERPDNLIHLVSAVRFTTATPNLYIANGGSWEALATGSAVGLGAHIRLLTGSICADAGRRDGRAYVNDGRDPADECQRCGSRATLWVCSKPQTLAVRRQRSSPTARRKTIDTVGDDDSICGCMRAVYPVVGLA